MSTRSARTQAELQIEALRQLRQTQARSKPSPAPKAIAPKTEAAPAASSFELSERAAPAKRKGPSLPLSVELWRRLKERQREHHEFKRRREMGDWAAELLLAMPPQAHKLPAAAREELLQKIREWAELRGLR